jgi:hypothetical protein
MVGVAPVLGAKTAEIEAGESGSWLPGSAWLATSPDVVPGLPARDAPEAAAAVDSAGMVAATAVALVADMSGVLAGMPGSSDSAAAADASSAAWRFAKLPAGRVGTAGRDSADGSGLSVPRGGTAVTGAAACFGDCRPSAVAADPSGDAPTLRELTRVAAALLTATPGLAACVFRLVDSVARAVASLADL